MPGRRCTRVGAACDRVLDGLQPGPTRALIEEVRNGIEEPLRVAVTGRVNAGKSTLVNALLRTRVAPTDVSECTKLVTWFRFGVPERVEVVHVDGTSRRLPLGPDGTLPASVESGDQPVSHLVVHLSNEALREMVLIDTPGLSSANEEYSRATTELLALDTASRAAVSKADAAVFVLTGAVRADEAAALESFRGLFGGLSSSALSAVGVLNKADLIGEQDGAEALAPAQALAERYAEQLRSSVATVVPLIGLLAETADSGVLTERDAGALRELAALPERTRLALLLSPRRFTTADAGVSQEARARLLAILDLYGIRRAIEAIEAGQGSAAALVRELRVLSGIDRLRALLLEGFAANTDALKASWALASLERLSYGMVEDGFAERRRVLRNEIEAMRLDADMHRISEIRALQEWASGSVTLPPELEEDLRTITASEQPSSRLGLDANATPRQQQDAASKGASAWKRFGNEGRATPKQRWLADVACRSYELLWLQAATGHSS